MLFSARATCTIILILQHATESSKPKLENSTLSTEPPKKQLKMAAPGSSKHLFLEGENEDTLSGRQSPRRIFKSISVEKSSGSDQLPSESITKFADSPRESPNQHLVQRRDANSESISVSFSNEQLDHSMASSMGRESQGRLSVRSLTSNHNEKSLDEESLCHTSQNFHTETKSFRFEENLIFKSSLILTSQLSKHRQSSSLRSPQC